MAHAGPHAATARRRVPGALYLAGILASLGVLLYLNIADLAAQWEAERHISQMQQLYRDPDDPARLRYLEQARRYNARLSSGGQDAGLLPYRQQLFYKEEPMMSFLEIPRISVRLPIYHGVAENALMAGVGHWERSALPVGGKGTRCVLMGHSGMRNTRMFDDLRKLAPGDKVVAWTLDDPYCYEVEDVETVLPEEVAQRLGAQPGRDLLTLITCTPHGVNSHRLLVHARRCAYSPAEAGDVGIDAYVNDRNLPLLAALAAIAADAVFVGTRKRAGSRAA